MKNTKRIFAILLAVVLTMAFAVPAFAATGTAADMNGSITIGNPVSGQTYAYYRVLDLEMYDTDKGAYRYKANDAWKTFLNSTAVKDVYVSFDDIGYAQWVDDADVAAFAKAALNYAKNNSIAPVGNLPKNGSYTAKDLALGYYLVDSSLGSLCALDTTNPAQTLNEKNEVTEIKKTVKEDSNSVFGETNDASIGEIVDYQAVITVKEGAENYVMHDKMSAGLTFNAGSVVVTVDGKPVDSGYTVKTDSIKYTFEVAFDNAYIETLPIDTEIVVSYTATVNEKAVIAGNGNPNEVVLTYGDENDANVTPISKTITYVWSFNVFKYTMKSNQKQALENAKFTLSTKVNGTDPIAFVVENTNVYRVATADDEETISEIVTDSTGKFTITGLDSDTYYLTETKAPVGFSGLNAPVKVVIDSKGKVNATADNAEGVALIEVENRSGSILPSTGGMGTKLMVIIGCVLFLAASVVLVAKKRVYNEG